MDRNEMMKEIHEMANNGASDRAIAKALGFKNTRELRKFVSSTTKDQLDYVGYCDYKY